MTYTKKIKTKKRNQKKKSIFGGSNENLYQENFYKEHLIRKYQEFQEKNSFFVELNKLNLETIRIMNDLTLQENIKNINYLVMHKRGIGGIRNLHTIPREKHDTFRPYINGGVSCCSYHPAQHIGEIYYLDFPETYHNSHDHEGLPLPISEPLGGSWSPMFAQTMKVYRHSPNNNAIKKNLYDDVHRHQLDLVRLQQVKIMMLFMKYDLDIPYEIYDLRVLGRCPGFKPEEHQIETLTHERKMQYPQANGLKLALMEAEMKVSKDELLEAQSSFLSSPQENFVNNANNANPFVNNANPFVNLPKPHYLQDNSLPQVPNSQKQPKPQLKKEKKENYV